MYSRYSFTFYSLLVFYGAVFQWFELIATTGATERAMAGILFRRGAAPRLFAADAEPAWLGE
jgi:hypothetical protein